MSKACHDLLTMNGTCHVSHAVEVAQCVGFHFNEYSCRLCIFGRNPGSPISSLEVIDPLVLVVQSFVEIVI